MGMPLVMLEMAYGQFSSLSPIAIWKMAPLFEGTDCSFSHYCITGFVDCDWHGCMYVGIIVIIVIIIRDGKEPWLMAGVQFYSGSL